jgi:hypothetical protein
MCTGNNPMLPAASKHVNSTTTRTSALSNTRRLLWQTSASPLKLRSAVNNVGLGKVFLRFPAVSIISPTLHKHFSPSWNFYKKDKWAKSGKLATTRRSSANRNDFGSKVQRLLLGHQTVTEDKFKPQLYHKTSLRHQTRIEFLKPPLTPVEYPSQHKTAGRRHTGGVGKCPLFQC